MAVGTFAIAPPPALSLPRLFPSPKPPPSVPRPVSFASSSISSSAAAAGDGGAQHVDAAPPDPSRSSAASEAGSVQCDIETVSWRERRVRASIVVAADADTVWRVVTDYERLAEFIPNLVYSGRIPCPHDGRIWLEQRGLQRALYWHIEARVVLDLKEFPDSVVGPELHFSMVDGDFKKFEGKWSIKSEPRSLSTSLIYEVSVVPRFNFPAIFLERIIRSDLPTNLQALACRAEKSCEENYNTVLVSKYDDDRTGTDYSSLNSFYSHITQHEAAGGASCKLAESPSSGFNSAIVPNSSNITGKWGVYGKVCNLDKPCVVDEIHLRRIDGLLDNEGAHRCVFASITVKAPLRDVWNLLTSYELLPEFVPNLAISKILSRDNNKVRILQEGCKGLLYMVLHARVILELREKVEREITFEQVEGDFDSFKGKWLLEQLGSQHTLLKYVVETKMHKDTFLSEAILEEVIYEDLPSNLCAIRDYVEKTKAAGSEDSNNIDELVTPDTEELEAPKSRQLEHPASSRERPKVPGLQTDFEVLKSELSNFISNYGQDGFMPMRKQLRQHGRVDIEKAITRRGGFRKIANMFNLSLAYKHRKPKGYWDSLENLQDEIRRFQMNWGMDPAYMPSRKSFERAGRYDIARALEKWGGLQEVSRLLSLKLRSSRKQPSSVENRQCDAASAGAQSINHSLTGEPEVTQDADKWLTKMKDLGIEWVE